jgi:hypothetical protein
MIDEIREALGTGQTGETHPHPLSGERGSQPGNVGDAGESIEKAAEPGQQQADVDTLCDQCRR